jgi:hypothetical protein
LAVFFAGFAAFFAAFFFVAIVYSPLKLQRYSVAIGLIYRVIQKRSQEKK